MLNQNLLKGKKVVFFFHDLELGGAERQGLILSKYLISNFGLNVEFVGFHRSGFNLTTELEFLGIKWQIIPRPQISKSLYGIVNLFAFVKRLRKTKPDIIMSFTAAPNALCGAFWKFTGAKICIWNQRDEGISSFEPKIQKLALKQVSHFISNSQGGIKYLSTQLGVSPRKISLIRNGIEQTENCDSNKAKLFWYKKFELRIETLMVCSIANLTSNKDHVTLIKSWNIVVAELKKNNKEAVLILAGRFGNTYENLKKLSIQFDLEKKIIFAGTIQNINNFLSSCDLSVLSSRSEGSPNGILESMATGLAVVGSDILGIRDAICEENRAFLVPVGDEQLLAKKILELLMDGELRRDVGLKNKKRIEFEYSPDKMGKAFADTFKSLLSGNDFNS